LPDVDFAMPYPCYFLMTKKRKIEQLVSEGEKCICLFTDHDTLECWYQEKYGANFTTRTVEVVECVAREQLICLLKGIRPQMVANEIEHIAIDPTPGKLVGRVTIDELLNHLLNDNPTRPE